MSLNKRAVALGERRSVIREIFEYANIRRAEIGADNVFDFSLGNPSIPAPQSVEDAIVDLTQNTDAVALHGYTSAQGALSVRQKLCEQIKSKYNYSANPNLMYLTCGAAASLTSTLGAILNEGDEVVVFAPFFPEYRVFIEGAGGVVKVVECEAPDFKLNLDKLEITDKTKAVILNSPNNPTGAVVSEDELKKLAEKLNGTGVYLISDEPYRELCYNGKTPFVPNFYHNTIVCYSYSKSLSLPGERIGYVLVSNECDEAGRLYAGVCGAARQNGFVCAPSIMQRVIERVAGETSDIEAYRKNRDLISCALSDIGYEITPPDGAFYLFVKALEEDANVFCERAKKHELLLVPSDDFGVRGWVRIAYCVSEDMIKRSLPAFKALFEEYKEKKNG